MAHKTSANLIRALYNLSREHDSNKRKTLLNAGLMEMIKWFSLAARKIAEHKMKLPKQTQKFMDKHKDDVRKLASPLVNADTKRDIILKPGGGGFFGGVIIRSLIRWDGNKILRRFSQKKTNKKKKSGKKKSQKKKKSPKKKQKSPKKKQNSKRKIKVNERFVTVRVKKPRKPPSPVAGPSTARTPSPNLSLRTPTPFSSPNLSLRTPSPFSTQFSTPSSSIRKIGERIPSAKTPSPHIARFSPLQNSSEPLSFRTARKYGFEAAMKQLLTRRKLSL